mmetsp:Transcript_59682/g.159712  ORF Transcript_59682/g.159712 Transcript_59682/m.159712 type:complete len:292 (+) Transcript_59682:832-1707(+)
MGRIPSHPRWTGSHVRPCVAARWRRCGSACRAPSCSGGGQLLLSRPALGCVGPRWGLSRLLRFPRRQPLHRPFNGQRRGKRACPSVPRKLYAPRLGRCMLCRSTACWHPGLRRVFPRWKKRSRLWHRRPRGRAGLIVPSAAHPVLGGGLLRCAAAESDFGSFVSHHKVGSISIPRVADVAAVAVAACGGGLGGGGAVTGGALLHGHFVLWRGCFHTTLEMLGRQGHLRRVWDFEAWIVQRSHGQRLAIFCRCWHVQRMHASLGSSGCWMSSKSGKERLTVEVITGYHPVQR